jgi:hypothetical protein
MRKLLLLGVAIVGVIGLSVVTGRPIPQTPSRTDAPETREPARPLVVDATAIRLLLGVGDQEPQPWGGVVSVDKGEIVGLEGWRFRVGDEVTGPTSWKSRSLLVRKALSKKVAKKKAAAIGPAVTPTGVIVSVKAAAEATLTVDTDQGEVGIPLADLAGGGPRRYLNGRVEAQIVPPYAGVVSTDGQEDFPSAVSDGQSGAWIAYVDHQPRGPESVTPLRSAPDTFKSYVPQGGGDQIKLVHFDGRSAQAPLDVTGPGRDVWLPTVALDASGKVVVVWSEQREGNWELFARAYDPARRVWEGETRLTTDPGTDTHPAVTTVGQRIHVAWQAWRGGQADIHLAPLDEFHRVINVSDHPANEWCPSVAAGPDGTLVLAFDSYRNGNYDVFLARVADGKPRLTAVADSSTFEARPSLGIDSQGRAWVAYEERTDNWGKDFGKFAVNPGTPLYRASTVRVRCVENDAVRDAGDPLAGSADGLRNMNAFARLTVDRVGRPWLLFRHRQENNWRDAALPVVGAVWYEYATTRIGRDWSPPQPVTRSDNLLDNRPSLVAPPDGPVLAVYSSDGRLHRAGTRSPAAARQGDESARSWVNNDVFVSALIPPAGAAAPTPGDLASAPQKTAPAHPDETEDVARMRNHRIKAGGKTYQLLRGEFHRHTEISADGGGDGALEDMWRYGLDAGALDWIGCGDHDNGGGKEYTWWLTQKTTDLHHQARTFLPMFTYERSVNYPGGHRNVMFPYRGVRTLPRLSGEVGGVQTNVNGRDLDAEMLFRYLNELGGLCAAHTSATDMGTDWRANDPNAEPIVEIYQGDRDSYEHLGGPRVAHNFADATGGWRPLGMVWNALAMQYKIGFQASSDHISTHISFAVALAEEPTREGIFDAFRRRHCYGATDNILLDVRCGEHLMGDEFTHEGPVTLRILAHGTGPIQRIDIVKDFHFVYSTEPKTDRAELRWTDEDPTNRNPSWYYVRVLQENGEIAWGSPMWISTQGRSR